MTSDMLPPSLLAEYQALTQTWGMVDVSQRTRIELTGEDRAGFLNGFCTNEIKRLEPGGGCEAFLTNAKGKTIGHGFVFCGPQSLVLETVPGQAESLLAHLDRYLIREDVQLHDRSEDWGALFLAGPLAGPQLSDWLKADLPERMSGPAWLLVYRLTSVGEASWLVFMPRAEMQQRAAQLASRGALPCGLEAFEIWRMEAGWPQFGRDITDANLPQEVNRDAVAISFTKGCYLGQETVARLDALGHVNRLLTSVRWEGSAIPAMGESLRFEDQPVGTVTSSVWSPRLGAPLALAYVRPPHHHPGSALQSTVGSAVVVDLRGTS